MADLPPGRDGEDCGEQVRGYVSFSECKQPDTATITIFFRSSMKNGSFTELWYHGWDSCYENGRECKPAEERGDVLGIPEDPFC